MTAAPDPLTLWKVLLLALVAAIAALQLAGLLYWSLRADLNTTALFAVARKCLDARDPGRLLKVLHAVPLSPIAAVLRHALTLDPATLRPVAPSTHPGGYRDEHPIDHAAMLRAHLCAVGYGHARTGHRLWHAGAIGAVVLVGVLVALGPWTTRYASLPWTIAAVGLALTATHAASRARVLPKIEAAADFALPHVGLLASRR